MSTLYELTGEYLNLLELAEDPDTDPAVIEDTLEALGGEIEAKADAYACVLTQMEGDAQALNEEIDRLKNRLEGLKRNGERIKRNLFDAMKTTGKTKFKTLRFSFGIRKAGTRPVVIRPGVVPEDVPEEYQKITRTFDKTAIRDALKDGETVSWAHLGEASEYLSIK